MFGSRAALSKPQSFRLGIAKSFVFEFAQPGDMFSPASGSSMVATPRLTSAGGKSAAPNEKTFMRTSVADSPTVLSPSSFASAEMLSAALDSALSHVTTDGTVADIWVPAKALLLPSAAALLVKDLTFEGELASGTCALDNDDDINRFQEQGCNPDDSAMTEVTDRHVAGSGENVPNLLKQWEARGLHVERVSLRELSPRADSGTHLPASLARKMSPHVRDTKVDKTRPEEMGRTGYGRSSLASPKLIHASANADFVALKEALLSAHPDDECAKHGASPLHLVASSHADESAAEECVRLLLEEGASIDKRASNGSTPLHWAAGNGNADIASFFLDQGADPSLMTFTWFRDVFGKHSGQTCLHWAAESGHHKVVEMLLDRCPWIVGSLDERGSSPRALALREAKFDTHDLLLSKEEEQFVLLHARLEGVVAVPLS